MRLRTAVGTALAVGGLILSASTAGSAAVVLPTVTAPTRAAHQPFMVDREWMAAWTPPGLSADHSLVYLTYHDFGPDTMWVNMSRDGGKTWSSPTDIITKAQAAASSMCDTVPAGIAVDPR